MAVDSTVLRAKGGEWHKKDREAGPVPTKGETNTARFALRAVFVYQLALLHRHEHELEVNRRLMAFLRAA